MQILDPTSLFNTLDLASEAILFGIKINDQEKAATIDFLISRQDSEDAYANTFAPTFHDLKNDMVLFTGEKVTSRVGKRHMAGEEASRIIRKLDGKSRVSRDALNKADAGLQRYIEQYGANYPHGLYCCKMCSCGLWLNMASGGVSRHKNMLREGMERLKENRDGNGKWSGFPYYYLLYILNEMDPEMAREEIRYAAVRLEKKRRFSKAEGDKYGIRRQFIAEKNSY